jgi:hypothetical protein
VKTGFGVPIQRRGAAGFVVGLGVRAARAGSIGRDEQRFGESPETPTSAAGGLGPRPVPEETSALWFQARLGGTEPPGQGTSWYSRRT